MFTSITGSNSAASGMDCPWTPSSVTNRAAIVTNMRETRMMEFCLLRVRDRARGFKLQGVGSRRHWLTSLMTPEAGCARRGSL